MGPRLVRAFRSFDAGYARAEEIFLAVALAAMFAAVFGDFVLRETLNRGLNWAKELAAFLMVWVGFVGASLAAHRRRHLVMQSASRLFPPALRRFTAPAACVLTAGLCMVLAWLGLRLLLETRAMGETALTLGIPLWPVQAAIPLAFTSIGLRYLAWGLALAAGIAAAADDGPAKEEGPWRS